MGARLNQNKPVIVWLPCDRRGCHEAFMLTSKKPSQRYCSHACYSATNYPKEMYQSPVYRSWSDMKTRCNNPKWKQYADYGGRGIKVCDRWSEFSVFLKDMGPTWAEGLTLDRIDVDADYAPDNCRWADWETQQNNKRNTRRLEFNGHAHTLSEWSEITGIKRSTLSQRYYAYGWPIERLLTEGAVL